MSVRKFRLWNYSKDAKESFSKRCRLFVSEYSYASYQTSATCTLHEAHTELSRLERTPHYPKKFYIL